MSVKTLAGMDSLKIRSRCPSKNNHKTLSVRTQASVYSLPLRNFWFSAVPT